MEGLRVVGEKLGKYELEKRHAIELEDYERARQKKNQMEEYRANAYQQICVEQLLENDGVRKRFTLACRLGFVSVIFNFCT